MPSEALQDAEAHYGCPVCGSSNTQRASTVVEDRIRHTIAAQWAAAPGPRGPDGFWLRRSIVAWIGLVALALVTSTSHFVSRWQWGALLLAAVVLGAWFDRRAARHRGWINPLQRAAEIVQRAQVRDAALDSAARSAGVATAAGAHGEHDLICLQCGHRFAPAPAVVSAA